MTTFYWNNELVLELIRMFEEKHELWDISSEHYRDRDRRQESWLEIASAMGTDVSTVERKMRMLMSQYRRELFTKRNNSRWFAFHRLSFLKSRQLAVSHNQIRKRPPCFVAVDQHRGEQSSKPNLQGDVLRIEKPALKDRLVTKQRDHKSQDRDEYTTYGELVAMKLKKIGNSYARSTAQHHINNILYKAEIGEYDKHPRQSRSYTSKEHFGTASPSALHGNYDAQSQRSSSTKSMEHDLKFEEIEEESDE